MKKVKTVFIAHPISGDIEANIQKVIAICKEIHTEKVIPIFPSYLWRKYREPGEDTNKLAELVNREYFSRGMVDEMWFYGNKMSSGMLKEAYLALEFNIPLIGKTPMMKKTIALLLKEVEKTLCQ